ncbi:hypothetical protein ACFRCW_47255, partial [Streptomyces sp. NPDC056653]|uniref:hypothetical protein n=1 Tax=Streptomyces sp. NPDC056653 TaxID=3345894 RepID=UPI00368A64F2
QPATEAQRAPQQENGGVHKEPPGTFERTGRLPLVAVAWMTSPSLEDSVRGCPLTCEVVDLRGSSTLSAIPHGSPFVS